MKIMLAKTFTLSAVALCVSAGIHAQEQNTNDSGADLEVITVTVNKRIERLQDVPSSVNVVKGDDLEKLNLTDFQNIEQLSPGLSLTSKEPTENSVTLRGIGYSPNSSTSPTVDIYFNETPIGANGAFKAMYDVGQIEVLRGPQGTLRGKTSPSGAITIASRKADLGFQNGYFQQTLTNEGGINSQGAFSLPIIEDVLAIRVAGLYDENQGLGGKNIANGADDQDRTRSLRASLTYKPTDAIKVDFTYQTLNNDTTSSPLLFTLEGEQTTPILTPDDRSAKSVLAGKYGYEGDVATLEVAWELDDFTVNYVGGYQDNEMSRATDLAYGGSIANFSQPQTFSSAQKTNTHELRLTSTRAGNWDYLFGTYYESSKSQTGVSQSQIGYSDINVPTDYWFIFDVGVDIPSDVTNFAFFTDHRFQLTERDQVQFGLRYQKQDVTRDFVTKIPGYVFGAPVDFIEISAISDANKETSTNKVTGAFSYRHQFSRDMTGYFSVGSSFRPGGVVATTATLDEDLIVFDAETSISYELGLKGYTSNNKINYSVALFQQDFDNYLAYTGSYLSIATAADGVVDNNVALTFNTDAVVRGIEASITNNLSDNFVFTLAGSYNDSEFKDGLAPCNDYNGDGISDSNGTPSVPVGQQIAMCKLSGVTSDQAKWNLSFTGEYSQEFSGGELFARTLLNYAPDREDPYINISYDSLLHDSIFLGFRNPDSGYEISLFVKNMSNDSTLVTRGASQVDYNVINTGYAVGTPIAPREIGLTFNLSF